MVSFSKSFGYAIRGILYTALACTDRPRVQVEEIARELNVPKYFLSKIMKNLVKNGILNSTKGPHGGFSINENTLATPLIQLMIISNGDTRFDVCVLRLTKCDPAHPCPLHQKIESYKSNLDQLLTSTTIGDLLDADNPEFISGIASL